MRFDCDGDDLQKPNTSGPSRRRINLDHRQRVEFLRLLRDGLGRTLACTQLGIDPKILVKALAKSPGFRRAVEHVEQVRADNLFAGLYVAALKGDTRAARFLVARQDRLLRRRRGRR